MENKSIKFTAINLRYTSNVQDSCKRFTTECLSISDVLLWFKTGVDLVFGSSPDFRPNNFRIASWT